MSYPLVLTPLFIHVALAFALMLGAGTALGGRARLSRDRWAEALGDPHGLAVLFYVLTLVSMLTRHADLAFVLLAFVFVTLRVLRAVTVMGGRGGTAPGLLDRASALVLAVAWGVFAVRILLGI